MGLLKIYSRIILHNRLGSRQTKNTEKESNSHIWDEDTKQKGESDKSSTGNNTSKNDNTRGGKHEPKQPPKMLDGFPNAARIPTKGKRATWRDKNGNIYEWDYKKGEVEVYDKSGKNHLGGFDPQSGKQRSPGVKGRRSEYYLNSQSTDDFEVPSVLIKVLDRFFSRLLGPIILPESIMKPNPKYAPAMEL